MTQRIGLIGCGNISDVYLTNAALFADVVCTACADLNPEAAQRQAARYGLEARSIDRLLGSDDVDIVLNLTIPAAHAEVSLAALDAGKHVYSEKPLATTLADGVKIIEAARHRGLRVGTAPDTVLGPGLQEARRLVDADGIGAPLTGVASVLSHGMEHWHPNPAFFFQPGGGPVFDMGPYYLTALVTLLGPVASVMANGQIGFAERIVTTHGSALRGTAIKVETLTSVQALLDFACGTQVAFLASWDVWKHGMLPIELHGAKGSLRVPDPNFFAGSVKRAEERGEWQEMPLGERPFTRENWPKDAPEHANYRGLGLADMAQAIEQGRPARCTGDVGLHVLAIMAAILEAAETRRSVTPGHRCERPAALSAADAAGLLRRDGPTTVAQAET